MITLKKKILAILCICALACVIFSGCTQSSPSESFTEQKTYIGTIKNIIFYPEGYVHNSCYQIVFEDGTWMVIQREDIYEKNSVPDEAIDVIVKKDVCVNCLKIGHTYEMNFTRADSQPWKLEKVKDA